MEPLPGLDAGFLALESAHTHLHVAAVLLLDPPEGKRSLYSPTTRFAQIRRMVAQRIHLVPQLRRRALPVPFGLSHPVWADDPEFDLDAHVSRAAAPAPGGPRELDDLVADAMSRPLDPDRPLWEMLVVEGLAGDRTALVAKVHHAVLDGMSGVSLLAVFFDTEPRSRPVPFPGEPWDPGPLPSSRALLLHAASSLARRPEIAVDALRRGADALVDVAGHNRRLAEDGTPPPPSPFSAPKTSLNGSISSRRSFATTAVALEDVTRVRRAFGVTTGDVLLAAAGGAVSRLLSARGERPEGPLVAMVPVSTRRRAGRGSPRSAAPGPVQGEAPGAAGAPALGNRISGMLVPLATDVEDPRSRLRAVSRGTSGAKAQERLLRGRLLEDVAEIAVPALSSRVARWTAALRLFDRLPPPFNVIVSTIPGPDIPLWCAGSRVAALYPVGPVADGVGLNVTSMTYQGSVQFGLLGCRRLVPDAADLAYLVGEAVAELVAATTGTRSAAG